jgi:hypothetical protein
VAIIVHAQQLFLPLADNKKGDPDLMQLFISFTSDWPFVVFGILDPVSQNLLQRITLESGGALTQDDPQGMH